MISGIRLSIWVVFKLLAHGIPFMMWVQRMSVGVALVAKIEIIAIFAIVAEATDLLCLGMSIFVEKKRRTRLT